MLFNLEKIMLSEISQPEKDKYQMISVTCGIQWTNWTNKHSRDRLIDREQADSSEGAGRAGGVEGLNEKEKSPDWCGSVECNARMRKIATPVHS